MDAAQHGCQPTIAVADWSVVASKRWIAEATPAGGRFLVDAARPVGDMVAFLAGLRGRPRPLVLGIDAVVGLPAAYARAAGIASFAQWLATIDDAAWERFASPAREPTDISVARPFYPGRARGARRDHLVAALGVGSFDELRRVCERTGRLGRAASPVFWTLGAQQVGRASLHCWETLVRPLVRSGESSLWPFDGSLRDLAGSAGVVIAEAYPAELTRSLGVGRVVKSQLASRRASAAAIIDAGRRTGVDLTPAARDALRSGCVNDDSFDALVATVALAAAWRAGTLAEPPDDVPEARTVEGWIAGI